MEKDIKETKENNEKSHRKSEILDGKEKNLEKKNEDKKKDKAKEKEKKESKKEKDSSAGQPQNTVKEKEDKKDRKEKQKEKETKDLAPTKQISSNKPIKKFFCLMNYKDAEESKKQSLAKNQSLPSKENKNFVCETNSNDIFNKKNTGLDNILSTSFIGNKSQKDTKTFMDILNSSDLQGLINEDFYIMFLKIYLSDLSQQRECCERIVDCFLKYSKKIEIGISNNYSLEYLQTFKKTFDKVSLTIKKLTFCVGGFDNTLNYISRLCE